MCSRDIWAVRKFSQQSFASRPPRPDAGTLKGLELRAESFREQWLSASLVNSVVSGVEPWLHSESRAIEFLAAGVEGAPAF